MKNFCIKTAALLGILATLVLFVLPIVATAQTTPAANTNTANYVPLIPVPCPIGTNSVSGCNPNLIDTSNIGGYASAIATVLYSMAGAAAVIGVVYGAFVRATSDAVSGQEKGRELIVRSFLGLIIIFGAYALLDTINPALLDFSLVNINSLKALINQSAVGGSFQNNATPSTQSTTGASNTSVPAVNVTQPTAANPNPFNGAY